MLCCHQVGPSVLTEKGEGLPRAERFVLAVLFKANLLETTNADDTKLE